MSDKKKNNLMEALDTCKVLHNGVPVWLNPCGQELLDKVNTDHESDGPGPNIVINVNGAAQTIADQILAMPLNDQSKVLHLIRTKVIEYNERTVDQKRKEIDSINKHVKQMRSE